ncbi:Ig-like domain-containing protein [bacterium]|nr:Ig-like domain-containing protein [bacterium]
MAGVWAVALLLNACAVVEPPPGGPEDKVRPHLEFMIPDSAATGLGGISELNLTFSEKMDRVDAVTWLHFFPDQRIRSTKWHGATRAEIRLEEPLPPDTVIVVEVAGGMKDAHKVANRRSRRYPIATGDSIPGGRISGVLVMADSAVSNGVLELFAVPPDTLEYFEQPLLRRTVTDRTGAYTFDWLPVPGGPYLVRAFADDDGNLRPGDNEAQRLLPDTLRLDPSAARAVAGVTTLYPPKTPGRLRLAPFAPRPGQGRSMAWTMHVGEEDTGWVPTPTPDANFARLTPDTTSTVRDVQPGSNRLVVFVDLDADSTFSGVPAALAGVAADSAALARGDSVPTHFLEPWLMVEGITVAPGLPTDVVVPDGPYSLTPWTPPPPPALPDSLGATDSTIAGRADSLQSPPPPADEE